MSDDLTRRGTQPERDELPKELSELIKPEEVAGVERPIINLVTNKFMCPYCPQEFDTYVKMVEHIGDEHQTVTASGAKPSDIIKALNERPPDYEVTIYEGNQAWKQTMLGDEIMWVLQPDGLQLYRNGKPKGAMGTSGLYSKGSKKFIAQLAHLLADTEGYHLSEAVFGQRTAMYLAGNTKRIEPQALIYLSMAEKY